MTEPRALLEITQGIADVVQKHLDEPYGPLATANLRSIAGDACVKLCGGRKDEARTLWKLIESDLGPMPYAAAYALVRASRAENLVPDIEAPEPT